LLKLISGLAQKQGGGANVGFGQKYLAEAEISGAKPKEVSSFTRLQGSSKQKGLCPACEQTASDTLPKT